MATYYKKATWNEVEIPPIVEDFPHSNEAEFFYNSLPNDLKIIPFLKEISNHYITKINQIITDQISQESIDQYDEVLFFKLNMENIDLMNYPFFTLVWRNEEEWYEYMENAKRILKKFKNLYFWKMDEHIFNKPILLENAPWVEFDIMIVLDIGYIIFLNKKNAEVLEQELQMYEKEIFDLIYSVRAKVFTLDK